MRAPVWLMSSEIAARRERCGVERRRLSADHGRDGRARRGAGGEADMLVAEGKPKAGVAWRRPDHRQAVGQGRPRPAPGFGDGVTEFDDTARSRYRLLELGE